MTFTFGQSEDISLAGDLFTDYTITVTGMDGRLPPMSSASTTFVLRIKNPCHDPDYVQIVPT